MKAEGGGMKGGTRKTLTAPDKTASERQIVATDKQIDALVYELYGLTEEEIRIVEGREGGE
jgi:hypothetical protein